MSEKTVFDEAKQKVIKKANSAQTIIEILEDTDYPNEWKKEANKLWVKVDDVKQVLGDLQKDFALKEEDLHNLKELFAIFPKVRGYNNEFYKVDELKDWKEKAEKLLKASKDFFGEVGEEIEKHSIFSPSKLKKKEPQP